MTFVNIDNHNLQILYALPLTLIILFLRYLFEKYVFTGIAYRFGIKQMPSLKNPQLERAYQSSTTWSEKQILLMSLKLDISEKQVEKWLRMRKNMSWKASEFDKFCADSWRWMYYSFSFNYGIVALWNKPWLWDIRECWKDVQEQTVTSDIWWYYMVPLSFYSSLLVQQISEDTKKEFWQMLVHHALAIILMVLSWIYKFVRVGTLVLLVHDFADIFLQGAKVSHYIKYFLLRDILFATFTVSWLVTRLGVYPFWIIWHCLTYDLPATQTVYFMFNTLLITLFVLHCFWTYVLSKFIMESFTPVNMENDVSIGSENEGHAEHLKLQ